MNTKVSDFYKGNTVRWMVPFTFDVSAATVKFRMAKTLTQDLPDLEITGEKIPENSMQMFFEIAATDSDDLDPGDYHACHEIVMGDERYTFNDQTLTVKLGVPRMP